MKPKTVSFISRVLKYGEEFQANREIRKFVDDHKLLGFNLVRQHITKAFCDGNDRRIRVVMKKLL